MALVTTPMTSSPEGCELGPTARGLTLQPRRKGYLEKRLTLNGRFIAGALALAFMLMLSPPAGVQHVNPTAASVKEEQLLGELKRITGECTIPDQKACTVEQPAGRDWRHFHEVTLRWIGAIAILGMIGLVVLFYLVIGTVRISPHRSGRVMVRFSALERFAHWMAAVCFIILMLTGLNITFGKQLILPFDRAGGV